MDKIREAHRLLLSSSLLQFTNKMFLYMNKTPYILGEHHKIICAALDQVTRGNPEYRRLIINIAPRYGKTLLASQMFVAYGLAINPMSKFIHLSYSGQLTLDNSMAVKDIINSEYYQAIFSTRIKYGSDTKAKWSTAQGGGVYATSTLGQITGFGAGLVEKEDCDEDEVLDEFTKPMNDGKFGGAIVIDDPIRPEDALSEFVREKVNRRFETTIRNRVNSRNTPIVIIMQRLHEHDLCGYLQEVEPDAWKVITMPVLYYDDDNKECSLWPFKHTVDELHKLRDVNPVVFDTQYMQNPKPIEGLLFNENETRYFDDVDTDGKFILMQIDPADEGVDRTCSAVYCVDGSDVYVIDVIYSQRNTEYTIPVIIEQMKRFKVRQARIESNSAWSLFRKEIKRLATEQGLTTEILSVHQRENKELRIFNQAPAVQKYFLYKKKSMQNEEYARFMKDKHSYLKLVKDQKDDGVDTDTAACEYLKRIGMIPTI